MSEMEIAAEATNFASLSEVEIQLPWTHCLFFPSQSYFIHPFVFKPFVSSKKDVPDAHTSHHDYLQTW